MLLKKVKVRICQNWRFNLGSIDGSTSFAFGVADDWFGKTDECGYFSDYAVRTSGRNFYRSTNHQEF